MDETIKWVIVGGVAGPIFFALGVLFVIWIDRSSGPGF